MQKNNSYEQSMVFSSAIYSRESILTTANEFKENFFFSIEYNADNFILHYASINKSILDVREFENRLIENSIREDIFNKTSDIRKMILARAFASTIIEDIPLDNNNNNNIKQTEWDDEDILKDWFEKE